MLTCHYRGDMGAVAWPPGRIAGYRLDSFLGQGSMAAVYLARDQRLRRQVAVKVLLPEPAGDAAFRSGLLRESRAAAALRHPHILPVYEVGEADGTVFVAMRYVSGGDARSLLGRPGPLPAGRAWRIIAQVASALDAAHARGLVHRGVKPANILLDGGDREPGRAYLADFGMSRAVLPGQVIAADQFAGILDYLAPEAAEGRVLDGRADLYSLACTGFELLCGTPPFGPDKGQTLMYAQLYAPPPAATARRPGLPRAVDRVLATALAKDPADRYPSCGRFAEELRAALGLRPGEQAVRPSPGTTAPESRPRARRPVLAVAAVGAVIAVAAAGVALSRHPAPGRPPAPSAARSARPQSAAGVSAATSPAGPSPPAALAAKQAAALAALLTSSAAARTALHQAVDEVGACANLPGAIGQLQDVVNQRASEYGRASSLATSALPDGAAVKSALIAALSSSLRADRDYLTWARQQQAGGCTPSGQSSAYNAAFSASKQADAAKEAFVQVWNPVAARYGIEQNSPRDI